MIINSRKVVMIGCGFVGSSSAFALMQSGLFSEMVLIDADQNRAEGEAMDISHGIIVITAGANQKPDETRLDLIRKNAGIMKSIIGEIKKRDFGGILLIVSNPVDILTYIALKESGYPANRVIGSGTVLDTGRFKYELGEHLGAEVSMLLSSANMETANLLPGVMQESVDCPSMTSANYVDISIMRNP